jgi:signal transduction histidine kinase
MTRRASRLLIVDDSDDDLQFFARLLRNSTGQPYEVTTARLGHEGVLISRSEKFDCILLDFHLPDMTGFELLDAISDPSGELPCAVIVVTGQGSEAIAVEAMKRGAQDYLVKGSIARENLLQTIKNAVEKVELRRQLEDARRQLAEHVKKVEDASRAKSEFLARMGHELRTPMSAVIGFAQLLLFADVEPLSAKQRAHVAQIIRGGNHVMAIIEDLLDVAKIEARMLRISMQSIDVCELLDEVAAVVGTLAKEKNVSLAVVPPPPGDLIVYADRGRLRQILVNFGSNAVKYNRPNGAVIIVTEPTDDARVRIMVADTGVGIPVERQAEVFQMFNRLGADRGPIEGTGIGLALCRHLSELMDSRIGFASEPGKGSQFWVEVPLAAHAVDAVAAADSASGTSPGSSALGEAPAA